MTMNIVIKNNEPKDKKDAKTVRVSAQLGPSSWIASFLKPGEKREFTIYDKMSLTIDEVETISGQSLTLPDEDGRGSSWDE
jgi:hypothetical protein